MDMTPANDVESAEAYAARARGMLQRLGDLAMALAERVGEEALAPAAPEDAPKRPASDYVLVFARAARIVRQTIALEARLAREAREEARRAQMSREELARERLAAERRQACRARRREAVNILDMLIGADEDMQPGGKRDPRLRREAERLIDREIETDGEELFLTTPLGELLDRISEQLKLILDWDAYDEPWAYEASDFANRSPKERETTDWDEDEPPDDPTAGAPRPEPPA